MIILLANQVAYNKRRETKCLVEFVQRGAPLATRRLTCVDSFITNSGSKPAGFKVSPGREGQGPLISREMARTAASVRGV